jgi:hypothetical protein
MPTATEVMERYAAAAGWNDASRATLLIEFLESSGGGRINVPAIELAGALAAFLRDRAHDEGAKLDDNEEFELHRRLPSAAVPGIDDPEDAEPEYLDGENEAGGLYG